MLQDAERVPVPNQPMPWGWHLRPSAPSQGIRSTLSMVRPGVAPPVPPSSSADDVQDSVLLMRLNGSTAPALS
jgi:hypothetical protein